ncbi:MAG: RNA-binding protein [Spirochaetales bacterium]|nr:MAG: RNA-binding protein [Spirochaetales bacterium]
MAKKLYVGNMSYSTTEDQLGELFAQYGNVLSVTIVKDRYTNQSKGFAFVEMEDDQAAVAAVSALNNKDFNGRDLRVDEAQERKPRTNSYR